jgi:hypothetical protein
MLVRVSKARSKRYDTEQSQLNAAAQFDLQLQRAFTLFRFF